MEVQRNIYRRKDCLQSLFSLMHFFYFFKKRGENGTDPRKDVVIIDRIFQTNKINWFKEVVLHF